MAEEKRCETCRFNPGVGHCVLHGPLGAPFPVPGICDGWESQEPTDKVCENCRFKWSKPHKKCWCFSEPGYPTPRYCEAWEATPEAPAAEAPDLPSPTTSAFISGLINELRDRVGKKAFGRVGLTFVIHEGMVSKYEWTDSTTVKPENGGGE